MQLITVGDAFVRIEMEPALAALFFRTPVPRNAKRL